MSPSATHEMSKVLATVREFLENNTHGSITLHFGDQGLQQMVKQEHVNLKSKQ